MTVVVFGNDHTNTVGVTQSLGVAGYYVINLLFGNRSDYVKSSRYSKFILWGENENDSIDKLLKSNINTSNGGVPIVCCCDKAALAVNTKFDELTKQGFITEYSTGKLPFEQYFEKDVQVRLAEESKFNVPISCVIDSLQDVPDDQKYPCLIKPLVSCQGAKSDIRICHSYDELKEQFNSLRFTKKVILQQYIDRDYEISILGCGLSNGECIIPAVEDKLTLYPKYVGLECLANVHPLEDRAIMESIKSIVRKIGYVGLFSIEMMHNREDGKFYFTEINMRNDGAQSFIYKYGVNLPECHVRDLLGLPQKEYTKLHPGYYIWDYHHFQSLRAHDISLMTWISEILKSKGMLMYSVGDLRPFFKQYSSYNPFVWLWKKIVK